MAASDWTTVSGNQSPPYSLFTKPIEKSPQDDRDYRLIQLGNGLRAMLIHDAKADKAAASIDVAVGHLSDPDDMPGLAHFCEHLLFMGTEQYPRENEYSEFLAKNNGSSNAYTSTTSTNFYFTVATPALAPALSRFAAFFHSPLFSPSCTSRELNAVDSEHKKNFQSDIWRIYQINKHLSIDGHVWRKFGSGHRESLSQAGRILRAKERLDGLTNGTSSSSSSSLASSPIPSRIPSPAPSVASTNSEADSDGGSVGRETRRRLVEWWTREYCASRMRLCIIGKDSLDDLADLASTLFSPIKNRGQDPNPMITEHPFGPSEKGTLVSVQTIMSFRAVEVSFPLGYQPPHWRYKPAHFISYFTGHEGSGSLHSYLKNKGWITALEAGTQNLARGIAMYKLTIHLTAEGFQNHRSVILAVFKYLSLLRSSQFPEWYQRERATLSKIRFRFAEKRKPEDYATWVTEHLLWPVPPELVLSAPQLIWEWDKEGQKGLGEKEVRDVLESLRVDQGRAVLMATAKEHAKITGTSVQWEKEPWYGTAFRVERFDDEFVKQTDGPNDIPELYLPGPNKFIPTNLDVEKREVAEPVQRPNLIRQTPLSTLWHKKDDQFWVPKAHIVMEIQSPVASDSPRNSILTRLYADLVIDSLTEFAYDAELAGLSYSVVGVSTGLCVSFSGYNDKIAVLGRHIMQKIKGFVVNPERLVVMKEKLKQDWVNFFLGQSHRISDYHARYLLSERQWTIEECLPQIPSVTADEVQNHAVSILSKISVQMLVAGNIYKDEAVSIAEMVEEVLESSPLPTRLYDRALILPQASNCVWSAPVPNPSEPNSALTYYMHVGKVTDQHVRVTLALLTQILTEPAFNILRTQEQLGYVVSCTQWQLPGAGVGGIRIIIQSEKSPAFLEERVEAFLDNMKSVIEEMGLDQFREQKVGLGRKWREAAKNLSEEAGRYWAQLDSGHLDFFRRGHDADLLDKIEKQDVLALFLTHVHPSSPARAKLSVQLLSQKPAPKKISIAAAEAFEELVRKSSLAVDDAAWGWRDEIGGNGPPLVGEFEKHWRDALGDQTGAVELLGAIPPLVETHPAETEVAPKEGVTYIKDIKAFKSSLGISEETRPLVEWNDLPVAKF